MATHTWKNKLQTPLLAEKFKYLGWWLEGQKGHKGAHLQWNRRWIRFFFKEKITWSLEVQSHHLGATKPEAKWVIVGWVNPLSFGVDTSQALQVVLQQLQWLLLNNALCLGFHKRTDFSEIRIVYTGVGGRKVVSKGRKKLTFILYFHQDFVLLCFALSFNAIIGTVFRQSKQSDWKSSLKVKIAFLPHALQKGR